MSNTFVRSVNRVKIDVVHGIYPVVFAQQRSCHVKSALVGTGATLRLVESGEFLQGFCRQQRAVAPSAAR